MEIKEKIPEKENKNININILRRHCDDPDRFDIFNGNPIQYDDTTIVMFIRGNNKKFCYNLSEIVNLLRYNP